MSSASSSSRFLAHLASFARKDVAGFVKWAAALYLTHEYVVEVAYTKGPSMIPTFNREGDVVLVDHVSRAFGRLERGDVVIAVCPYEPRKLVCKRLVAMEGDALPSPHAPPGWGLPKGSSSSSDPRVPKGHVWLQGDNLSNSTDSRNYGPVPYNLLRGRVFYKVWPPSDIGPVERKCVNA